MALGRRTSTLLRLFVLLALTTTSAGVASPLRAQVVWEVVTEKEAEASQVLVPALEGPAISAPAQSDIPLPTPIVWVPVEDESQTSSSFGSATSPLPSVVVWDLVPSSDPISAAGLRETNQVVWELIPSNESPLAPAPSGRIADSQDGSSENHQDPAPPEALAIEQQQPPRSTPELPAPARLQTLNRSIAYSDGLVGPDIGWRVPNGFRWSQRWFGDASIRGFSRRRDGEDFLAWNNGDAVALLHANVLQAGSWSVGLNTSFRSVYQGDNAAGGSTQVGEGVSSGFRIATEIGDTGGIAFGGEQVVQWDDKTDTGRNLYLMASKGWWLGANGKGYPLLIANGGFGTGRFSRSVNGQNPQFACINDVEDRTDTFRVDNDLCWSPIGTASLVINPWWGMFVEYNSGRAQAAASMNLTGGIPLRLTWGVEFARRFELKKVDELTWIFQASFGF